MLTAFQSPEEQKIELDVAQASGVMMALGGAAITGSEIVDSIVTGQSMQAEFTIGGAVAVMIGLALARAQDKST